MGKKDKKAICLFGANFMLEQINNLQNEIDGVLVGDDIEFIHRMRVASRRLRNAMSSFKDCLPEKKSKPWRDEIRCITHTLGSARDLDIQIECLNQLYDDQLDSQFKPGYQRILLRLKQRRASAQEKVSKTIKNIQKDDLLSRMGGKIKKMTAQSASAYLYTPSLYKRAFSNINANLDDFLSYQGDVQVPENIEKLHAMRIAGKQLRYTLEIFAPIYDTALIPYIGVMKDLQELLGDIHDDDVWVSWLPTFIAEEQERIQDYFGNVDPLKRLLPGINHLIENRQKDRHEAYQSFIATWKTIEQENTWDSLKEIINAPINVEEALKHLASEKSHASITQENNDNIKHETNPEVLDDPTPDETSADSIELI